MPLVFDLGEAFQFDWSEEGLVKAPTEPGSLEAASTPLKLVVEPLANVQRYDRLRGAAGETAP